MKIFLRIILLVVLLAVAAIGGYFFIDTNTENQDLLAFVPDDFIYLIESDRPVGDWQDLSKTQVWQELKATPFFADITESADYLDSLLNANQTLVDFIELGDLLISAHMVSRQDYEFVFLVDLLGKGRKLAKIPGLMSEVFEGIGYEVSKKTYIGTTLFSLYDKEYDETLTMTVMGNVMIASYKESLVKKAIQQSGNPSITENLDYFAVKEKTDDNNLYSVYFNFGLLDRYMGAYTTETPEMMEGIGEIVSYAGWDLDITDEEIVFEGVVNPVDSVPSFLNVFKDVGKGKIKAPEVLPKETAMFTSIGFDDFSDFYQRFSNHYQLTDPEGFADLQKNQRRLEKLLKLEIERDLFGWMTDEIVTAVVPTDAAATRYSYYAMLHFDDYELAKERLDYMGEKLRKRTPVKFKEVDYRGYSIKYLDLKGFFKLFFKKFFSKIEQPHFALIDDYVVFTNDTTSLQRMVDAYLDQEVLAQDEAYEDFADHFDDSSNIFTYLNNTNLFHYLSSTLDYEARKGLQENRAYLTSFPQVGFQLYPGSGMYKTYLYGEFLPDGIRLSRR